MKIDTHNGIRYVHLNCIEVIENHPEKGYSITKDIPLWLPLDELAKAIFSSQDKPAEIKEDES